MAELIAYKIVPHYTRETITYEIDELVRCKDCKWVQEYESEELQGDIKPGWFPVKPNWFCADGERK